MNADPRLDRNRSDVDQDDGRDRECFESCNMYLSERAI